MRNISDKVCREHQNTHFTSQIVSFMGYCGIIV